MNPCTLEEFLALPWSPKVRAGIKATLSAPGRSVLVALHTSGNPVRAMVYPRMPASLPADAIALYRKPLDRPSKAPSAPLEALSRTAQALALVDAGKTPTEAAQALGISPPAVFRALARRAKADRCPHCGQTMLRAAYPVSPDA